MTEQTKITLSAYEQELVINKEWILTKHIIIGKVYELFGSLSERMQELVNDQAVQLPATVPKSSPKISRGENYQGLPYVMLDYPRHFTRDDTLAIRTFFWWGNFFSSTLQLAGESKTAAIPALLAAFSTLQAGGYYISVQTDAWQHHFGEENYLPLSACMKTDFKRRLEDDSFVKIAKKISLQQWDAAPAFLEQHFSELIELLKVSYPGGEKDLSPGTPIIGFDL